MSRAVLKPGPTPMSCLTCRQRRKKCDLARPGCDRCLKGGYECLGYEKRGFRTIVDPEGYTVPIAPRPRTISPDECTESVRSEAQDSITVELAKDRLDSNDTVTDHDPRSSILGAALLYRISEPNSFTVQDHDTVGSTEEFDRLWPQDQNRLTVYSHVRTRQPSHAKRLLNVNPKIKPSNNELNRTIRALCRSIPAAVDATHMMRENYSVHILNQYHLQRANSWFMTPPAPIRDALISRLKGSKRVISTLYLGIKLFQALSQDSCSLAVQKCLGWVDNLEEQFITDSHGTTPMNDISDRLTVQIELAFLKFTAVDTASGYTSLQRAVPRFLQLVAADTTLYTELPNGNLVVSLPRTLGAIRHELKQFVLYDTAASLVLGVPPLIEYGYDGECDSRSHGLEWVHGIPVALVQIISQVNSWRARSKTASLDDWQQLERRVLAWKPQLITFGKNSDANKAAKLVVQESWRHVVLIYIYMGLCGVSSQDSRVQASVNRIVEIGESVANLSVTVQMFAHFVVAGLAARLEKHRIFVYEKLRSFKDSRVWFFRGPQLSQVLYHLWHDVGSRGAPVAWDDYIRSRCAVIPI